MQDFIKTTGVAARGWLLGRDEREGGDEWGWGRLKGARKRCYGGVEGAGAEVAFPLSFRLPMLFKFFYIPVCLLTFFPTLTSHFELLDTKKRPTEDAKATKEEDLATPREEELL